MKQNSKTKGAKHQAKREWIEAVAVLAGIAVAGAVVVFAVRHFMWMCWAVGIPM